MKNTWYMYKNQGNYPSLIWLTCNSLVMGCVSLSLNFIVWRINLYLSCISYHIIFISFSFSFLFPLLGRGSLKFKIYLGTFDTQKWSLTLFWGLIIVLNIFCRFFFPPKETKLNFLLEIINWAVFKFYDGENLSLKTTLNLFMLLYGNFFPFGQEGKVQRFFLLHKQNKKGNGWMLSPSNTPLSTLVIDVLYWWYFCCKGQCQWEH